MKAKVMGMKIGTHIYLGKLIESIKKTYDVMQLKNFKFSCSTPISHDPLHNGRFSKNGAFPNDLKGVVMKSSPGGKPRYSHFFSLCLHLISAPPPCEFHSHRPEERLQ